MNCPRLNFFGSFQSDVSTVNNDPRHYDTENFTDRFQQFQEKGTYNGWWNPIGTGIFRLSQCTVSSVYGKDGALQKGKDSVFNFHISNSPDAPSAKLVDLDPDWQLASMIFGFTLSLTDGNGNVVMKGNFKPSAFRDLWFGRGAGSGDSGASAMFQSILTNVEWNDTIVETSPFLKELKAEWAHTEKLSVRLTTYAYNMNKDNPVFTYGTVVGSIGPAYATEPETFILGRRMVPSTQNGAGDMASAQNIASLTMMVDPNTRSLIADFSNALPLDSKNEIQSNGSMEIAILLDPETTQNAVLTKDQYISLGNLDQSQNQQSQLGGIQVIRLSDSDYLSLGSHPLALVQVISTDGTATVSIRETSGGLMVRPEPFTFRLDPGQSTTATLYAAQYGGPISGSEVRFWAQAPTPDAGNSVNDSTPGTTPQGKVPIDNIPPMIVSTSGTLSPSKDSLTLKIKSDGFTDTHGKLEIQLIAPDTMGTPRGYLDGQLFVMSYNFSGDKAIYQPNFENLAAIVYSSFSIKDPENPTWEEIQPVLQQYANLYPIMSNGLFDFSVKEIADKNAQIMHFVFSKDFEDPDYMPVTRDLSEQKRAALLKYFTNVMNQTGGATARERMMARHPMGSMSHFHKGHPSDEGLGKMTKSPRKN